MINTAQLIMKSLLLVALLALAPVSAQEWRRAESLRGAWKFEIGDDPAYSARAYDDSRWEPIRVPGAWLLSNAYSDTLFPMGIASPCGSILSAVICVVAFTVLNRRGAFDKLAA